MEFFVGKRQRRTTSPSGIRFSVRRKKGKEEKGKLGVKV
jgi:hypothetical protein